MMHLLRLLGAALFTLFVAAPAALFLALLLIALGVTTAVGLGWGVFSLVAWLGLGRPEAARSALFSLGAAAVAFFAVVVLWDRVFAAFGWLRRRRRGVDFHARFGGVHVAPR